jgi:peroxiredoxin Q/BCP
MPAVGSEAPAFDLPDHAGNRVKLAELRGGWVVLYFYPKDDTPGCTKEACNLRDNHSEIAARGAVVIGVSADTPASHAKFVAKYELPFTLLGDSAGHEVARHYGAWGTKNMYGREYEGVIRATFIIDPGGRVAKVWPRVKPDRHGEEVLNWLTQNSSS